MDDEHYSTDSPESRDATERQAAFTSHCRRRAALRSEASVMSTRYPLYCVDRGDVFADMQFLGPFKTQDEAIERANPGDWVARCRQLQPSEIRRTLSLDLSACQSINDLVDLIDDHACSGWLPEGAWCSPDDYIVRLTLDDSTLPTHSNLSQWLDDHCELLAYICDSNECHPPS